MQQKNIYTFGDFELDPHARVLFRQNQALPLSPKAIDVLLMLLRNSPNVVTKEDLLSTVWPGRVVDDHNLTQCVATVRKALCLEAGRPGFIETFPGRGYRVAGPVTLEPQASPHQALPAPVLMPAPPPSPRRWLIPSLAAVAVLITALGLWRIAPAGASSGHAGTPNIAPLSRLGGKLYQPAVSPDGSTLAFLWQKENGEERRIWIQALKDGTPRLLTTQSGDYSSPTWSPDGRSVACLRFRENSGDLVVIDLAGDASAIPRKLASVLPTRFGLSQRHLDWSPDGQWIALDDAPSRSTPLSIHLLNLRTGARTTVSHPPGAILGDVAPRWSPDGRRVSFIRFIHRVSQELHVLTLATNAVMVTAAGHQISDQSWLRGTPLLAFASNHGGGEFRIFTSKGGAAPAAPTGVYGEFPIHFAPAGPGTNRLVYGVVRDDPNIWRYDLTASTWKRLIASTGEDASPQYSPDGTRICFRSDRAGQEQLWVASSAPPGAAGFAAAVPITAPGLTPSVPRWSPDGHAVVFNTTRRNEIMIAREGTAGSGWQVSPLAGARGVHPVYSPDGRSIYAGGENGISRIGVDSGSTETISPLRALSLGISPDGTSIYFVRESAGSQLWRLDLASTHLSPILDGLVPYCGSCWAVAPNGIFFLGSRAGSSHQQALFFHAFATARNTLVAPYPEPILPLGIGPFSLSPDRKFLLTVRLDPSNSDLLLVESFL